MLPTLIHCCKHCSSYTPVPYSASAFSQNQICSHCGALSHGVNVASEEVGTKLDDMQSDELAGLFSRTLVLSQQRHQEIPQEAVIDDAPQPQIQEHQQQTTPPSAITYSSQHYTHSYHIKPRASSEPARTEIDRSEIAQILLRNSIDPTLLFPSQINLFQHADDDQRLRLLELWRISPPNNVTPDLAEELSAANMTSLQKEETMARIRYERILQQHRPIPIPYVDDNEMSMDMAPTDTFSPGTQSPSSVATDPKTNLSAAEPYILSGYEYLAQREYEGSAQQSNLLSETTRHNTATDPVYNKSDGNGVWQKPDLQDMENNYGAFEQMREYGVKGVDMNNFMGVHGLDEDMMM